MAVGCSDFQPYASDTGVRRLRLEGTHFARNLGATPHRGEPFALIDECFNSTGAVTKRSVSHPYDRQLGALPRGVIPHPISADI